MCKNTVPDATRVKNAGFRVGYPLTNAIVTYEGTTWQRNGIFLAHCGKPLMKFKVRSKRSKEADYVVYVCQNETCWGFVAGLKDPAPLAVEASA